MSFRNVFILTAAIFLFVAQPALARSGCCSHHGGVMSNGCGCNDGTPLSSTCAPYYTCTAGNVEEEQAPAYVPPPTSTPKPYIKPTAIPTRIPTKAIVKIPTKTPTPTLAPTSVPAATPTSNMIPTPTKQIHNLVQKPKQAGFWGFFLSLFGMNN
jgi:hypothetical protein